MLFDAFSFTKANKTIQNRIALAPLTNMQSHNNGTISPEEHQWLVSRAQHHFSLIITCAAHVSKDGQGWQGELGIYDDQHIEGLNKLTTAIRQEKSLSVIQLFHGGSRSSAILTGMQPWSASAHVMPHAKIPVEVRAATTEDISRVIDDFVNAAVRAHQAGFDGVELHGAHGYLLHQFLSTATNQRTDEWGGSLENRCRLILTITEKIKTVVPTDFLVGVRLSPEDKYTFQGIDFDDSLATAQILARAGIDYLHVSTWEALKKPDKYADKDKALITYFRDLLPDMPILVAGKIWNRQEAEQALQLGADIVAVGMAAIAHANWPALVKDEYSIPALPPYSVAHLQQQQLSPAFIDYMKRWKGFVIES